MRPPVAPRYAKERRAFTPIRSERGANSIMLFVISKLSEIGADLRQFADNEEHDRICAAFGSNRGKSSPLLSISRRHRRAHFACRAEEGSLTSGPVCGAAHEDGKPG